MKQYIWNTDKSLRLKQERGVSFEDVLYYIQAEKVVDIISHPNPHKYKGQKIYIININDYIYLVPFIETDEVILFKTIIPSRKYTKIYLGG